MQWMPPIDGCLHNLPNVHSASNDPFLKGKTFLFCSKNFCTTDSTYNNAAVLIEQNFCRVGWLVNDLVGPQTNIYANTSNAAISDPALPSTNHAQIGKTGNEKT